jgi:hypothetical protein
MESAVAEREREREREREKEREGIKTEGKYRVPGESTP